MRVVVTGSSGLIGAALVDALEARGDVAIRLQRRDGSGGWNVETGHVDVAAFEGADAVVHLAGESIGGWWTDAKKHRILRSRIDGTALISQAVAKAGTPVLVVGSAIGYYGSRGDEILTERADQGAGFLADVVDAWEAAAEPAIASPSRVALARTSIVLDADGGSLKRLLLPFRLGVGGRIGSGDQYWSWITLEDEVRAILHLIDADIEGPVNVSAPNPVPNADFSRSLGRALRRPAVLPAPAFGLKLLLSPGFAEEVLLASQRVVPEVLTASGFEFFHPTLETAFKAVL
jgi:uncharacterized protein (TIGR01777 family)